MSVAGSASVTDPCTILRIGSERQTLGAYCSGERNIPSRQMSSSKRMVSSVQITLAPPWRTELSQKTQSRNPEPTRADFPPGVDSWQDSEDLQNGDLRFRSTFLDEIPPEDCLSQDLPPPPPSPPVLPLSPKRVPLDPSPAPIPDSLSLELQKLDLTRPPPSQRPLKTTRSPSDNQEKREEAAPVKQSVNGHKGKQEGSDICAFCHKTIPPSTATIEAMKKQYHASCFTCRKCHRLLAGQMYYQKDGQPICEYCYKDLCLLSVADGIVTLTSPHTWS